MKPPIIILGCANSGTSMLARILGGKNGHFLITDHIALVPFFKEMFPDALFVFIVRNPWHKFQSMYLGGTEIYLLFTKTVLSLPDDLLLRAAHSWKECIDLYLKYKNENWTLTRYENIVYDAGNSISKMFNFLGINDSAYFERAVKI